MVIAAFLAIFGAVGLMGVLSGWNVIVTLAVGGVVGLLLGRLTGRLLSFVRAQQSEPIRASDVIGLSGRVTINTPAGKTGEAIFSDGTIAKHPIRAMDGGPLRQGEQVVVVETDGGILYVRRTEA
ncbi:MAG: hypothetical protein IPK19_11825 [Chloroflexi bacterium]|nr:hypothetical protein [Chloroflexota bacterium]